MRITLCRGLALIVCVTFGAGCSGGGSLSAPAAPKGGGSTQPSSAKKQMVSITFAAGEAKATAVRTSGAKHLEYVSPATLGAVITATSTDQAANDARFGYDLSAGSSYCVSNPQGGSLDCTLSIPLAVDTYQIELDTYDANDSGLPPTLGTELSTQTQTVTVAASSSNTVTFDPHALVAGFCFQPGTVDLDNSRVRPEDVNNPCVPQDEEEPAGRRRESTRRPQALESPQAAFVFGEDGGSSEAVPYVAAALDRDGYPIDEYPGVTTFANGFFTLTVAEPGDETGCTSGAPCASVSNSNGTSYAPYATPTTPATISLPDASEDVTVKYSGGGGPGAGVTTWTVAEGTPAGTQPFYAKISLPDPSSGTISPYVVPSTYLAALFGYSTDGNGNAATTTPAGGGMLYVWAAQAMIPSGSNSDGSSYYATFDGNSVCQDSDANTVMSVGSSTYHAGYGAVFPISVTPDLATSCVLDLGDGFGDVVSVTLTAPASATPMARTRTSSAHRVAGSR